MRRIWIGVAPVVAIATLGATAGTAMAAGPATRVSANGCSTLINRYQHVSSAASNINPTDPNALQKGIKDAANAVNFLAKNGPSQLRSAFKDLAGVYRRLGGLNYGDPTSLSQLQAVYTPRVVADLQKIAQYFSKSCGFTIPTVPST